MKSYFSERTNKKHIKNSKVLINSNHSLNLFPLNQLHKPFSMTTMRFLLRKALIFSFLVLFASSDFTSAAGESVTQADGLPSIKGKKVLLVWGGWDGHKPKDFMEIVAPWLKEEGTELIISDSLGVYTNKEIMGSVDLIIQMWTMGKISKDQEKALLAAVKGGVGLAGIHGGLGDSFRDNTEYQYMVGGQWVAHPGNVIDYTVEITNHDDLVTKGVKDFKIKSEQYYMHVDPNMKVLATTTFSGDHDSWIKGATMPVVWKKYYGKGRIFYFSIGHDPAELRIPDAWQIWTRGVRWASASKYEPYEEWLTPMYPGK
jgi:uncharacterized protein